jgi:hypothetical protein
VATLEKPAFFTGERVFSCFNRYHPLSTYTNILLVVLLVLEAQSESDTNTK